MPRCPFACIVPPHMMRALSLRGDAKTRKMAEDALGRDERVRNARAGLASGGMAADPRIDGGLVARAALDASCERCVSRKIYDGGGKAALPGALVRAEGDPPVGDPEVDRAYDGAGAVHDLYEAEFGRHSLDGRGMELEATVRHRNDYNNAFWDGERMAYGGGDGVLFRTFTELSVIGHEMSHGVVQFSGGLIYQGQSGALNESFADVFGALAVQRQAGEEAHEADWLIGKGILGPEIRAEGLRSLKAPGLAYDDSQLGKDPQPFHMDFYVETAEDHGGAHINSGIPNHAFYLFAQMLGGRAWERPGRIWYRALERLNNPMATFGDWAAQTLEAAIDLHGAGGIETTLLRRAWRLVGVAL